VTSKDLLALAWVGLARNRLRSGLTALGVCVGVYALTAIVAIGGGLEASIMKELTDGENPRRIVIRPGFGKREKKDAEVVGISDPVKADRIKKSIAKRTRGGPGQRKRKQLTLPALAAISSRAHVASVRPLAIDRFKARSGEDELDGAISYGVAPSSERWQRRVILGDALSDRDAVWVHEYLLYRWGYRSDAEQQQVVGREIVLSRPEEATGIQAMLSAAQAYGYDVPVDPKMAEKMLQAFSGGALGLGGKSPEEARELTVRVPIAGVIRERIEEDGFDVFEDSFSMQADIFLPQSFAEKLFAQVPSNVTRGYNAAALLVDSVENVRVVESQLREDGYRVVSIDTILERVGQVTAMLTAFVFGLSAIALVVAMLGIVNTMIMNVSERTREIGVFKALGATDSQVRGLFLFESALIGLGGGLVGVALALLSSIPGDAYVRHAIHEFSQYRFDGSLFAFTPELIALALVFAVGLSVLAALGPSTRASKIDPVLALRDE